MGGTAILVSWWASANAPVKTMSRDAPSDSFALSGDARLQEGGGEAGKRAGCESEHPRVQLYGSLGGIQA